jgi:uncharacterized protein (DUF1684 family)
MTDIERMRNDSKDGVMRRFCYGMLAALALPCQAAEPAGYQEWLQFKQAFAEEVGGPTGMYAIQDMMELNADETAHLPANKVGSLRWSKTPPSAATATVKYMDKRALASGPGIQSTDLLQLQGKALPLGNGLAVKATLRREKTLKLWLYDAKLPEQRKFTALEYFPYDPKGRITAPFRRNEKPVAVSYLDSRQQAGTMYEVGSIEAQIDGKKHTLKTVSYRNDWKEIDTLLLLLRDRTSGKTTYGGGRVVDISIPKGAPPATITFDLNMAYSFLCAHSEFYNCPLVLTNRVDADLTFGEKYPPKMSGE